MTTSVILKMNVPSSDTHMRILGLDPGTRVVGYGVIDLKNRQIVGVAAGVWRLDAKEQIAHRLAQLAVEFRQAVRLYQPTHLSIELAFLAENVRSALYLGQSRGVVLSEAHQHGLFINEVSATSAKKMLTGYGRADKSMVAHMVSQILKLDVSSLPFDATDALCLAYALAIQTSRMGGQASTLDNSSHGSIKTEMLKQWEASNKTRRQGKGKLRESWERHLQK